MAEAVSEPKVANWHDQQWHAASAPDVALWKRANPTGFRCGLCGTAFVEGAEYRWVYCNSDERSTGNFFTCRACDGDDVKAKRLALYDEWRRLEVILWASRPR